MNGNNTQTKEGFIGALGHPRKKELAAILLGENPTVEATAAAGFDRVTTLEMAREIKRNVQGMEDFSFEWPCDNKVAIATPAKTEEVAETANAGEGTVATGEGETAPTVSDGAAVGVDLAVEGGDTTVETVIDPAATPEATVEDTTSNSAPVTEQTPVAPESAIPNDNVSTPEAAAGVDVNTQA